MTTKTSSSNVEESTATTEKPKKDPAKKGISIVALLIITSLAWYLLADRFTPYSQQARVQTYVVAVTPEVSGQVTRVAVTNNKKIAAGELLFEIDPKPYQIAVDRANADLANVRNQIGAGSAGIDSAKASLRASQANELKARQDRDRLERLYSEDSGTISLRRLEVSRATLEQATSQVASSKAEVQRAKEQEGGDGEDNAQLRAAKSNVETAKLNLQKTKVYAKSDSLITNLRTDVGQFAAAGAPQMTLVATNDLWVTADLTENNLGHLKSGTPVSIILDAMPGHVLKGKIRSIGYGVTVTQAPAPGTLPTVQNNRDWLRAAQRFPVIVDINPGQLNNLNNLRVGGQAEVMAFPTTGNPLNLLGHAFMRFMSWLSYAY